MITATSRAERARQAELRELAALMRERGSLAPLPPPAPLHKMAASRGDGKRDGGDGDGNGDGGQAADGHQAAGQAVNRHGVPVR